MEVYGYSAYLITVVVLSLHVNCTISGTQQKQDLDNLGVVAGWTMISVGVNMNNNLAWTCYHHPTRCIQSLHAEWNPRNL